MAYTIALAGKGGGGKTTIAGMLIKYMKKRGLTPILAVDADSNYNLNEVLGLKVTGTLGDAREDMKRGTVPSGMTKDIFISMRLEEAVIETGDVDLLVMGQPEGTGCYCAANTLLINCLERLSDNYPYIVMDNEAGMEHISRLTTRNVDVLIIVGDASRRGLQAAVRINHLASELKIGVVKSWLILNQVKNGVAGEIKDLISENKMDLAGTVPEDDQLYLFDSEGKPTVDLPEDNPAMAAAFAIFDKIIQPAG
ncbi:MAG: carbon monoxide dehydrogenase [Desulfobacterales bacterium CG23_combo_of_CG06-09_8_20_14_all_51_8]|nr:MAG: carbon monoxide dehydrogenase [Desulfobacterales bacterium CG23_combo_of_CG06-09_8_20_14_all_51_8]